ncbi:MAG: UTP--glucose-1-phosphate uridylyltransferase GalU [Alphaproteobacteria bacterium]|jgi:UTP--glucose-1-phosphate uridylyltransferase|nr:UTP--glucose-1-phosphate uridylyltransferase GalU [Alphaproteobacteria bacterium]MBT5389799.1 UTP--glucose-1-phosphate uridylyltransferase GalU [Alphaproteobacteria bacterium]MBT5540125.1 UTP--glucose-1-phosphate uridylyltransferase GalU [Alphaproteobacteria bacterium]
MKHKVRKAIFPVGGFGTRFLPATKSVPKELLPVVDRPLIQFAVEEARLAGIEEFIFVTGRGKSPIEDYFDHSYELDSFLLERGKLDDLDLVNSLLLRPGQISYTRQQEPLGLGHAVWCARHLVGDEPFAVILPDDLIQAERPCLQQMVEAFEIKGGNMLAVMDVEPQHTPLYGILDVKTDEGHFVLANGLVEKPLPENAPSNLAVIGRYILQPDIFDVLEEQEAGAGGEIQLTDAIASLVKEYPLNGVRFIGERFDCGTKEGLLAANISYALERADMRNSTKKLLTQFGKQLTEAA